MHPLPEKVGPEFNVQYDEAIHGDYLREHLKISHLIPDEQKAIIRLVKKYWCVFNPDGLKFPVISYECYIDTGVNRPVAARNIHYGPRESEIMNKHISVLLKLGHIESTPVSSWLSKALLAPKPHQESIYDIKDFKWRFCVNYIGYAITKVTWFNPI